MNTLLLFLRYYAPFMVWDKADQGTFNAVSGFATASSLNVAVMGHDTARGRGTLYITVWVCVWVMEAVSASVVKELNTCAVKWQLTE